MSPNSAYQKQGHGFRHSKEERIGIYVLKEPIGAGYFAEVWRALDTSMNRQVALKIFYDDIIARPEVAKAILREAETQARVQSDRVTPIFACHLDHDSGPGPYYIAMRLMPGGTLDDLLERESPLPIPRAISIIRDIIDGLKAAHEADIVHRDLKPNNVLFDVHGRAVLADFGIAKDLRSKGRRSSIFGRPGVGTPHYMSPEQHLGTKVTKAWDIYSVGVLLYEMLSGTPPFNASSDTAIYRQKVEHPVPPLRDVVPDLPPRLELVIQRCLDPDVASRYPDCDALERALDWAMKTPVPPHADSESSIEEVVKGEENVADPPPRASGQPLQSKAASVNERIGNYQLISRLGLGTASEVWQAQDVPIGRKVAVKILRSEGWGGSERESYREVLQSQWRINSDGVVPIYEIHLDGSSPYYLVTKLMPGGSLGALLRNRSRLQLTEGLTIIRQVIKGLYAAHSAGLIHGNITMENILLEAGGIAALSDFGARQTVADSKPPDEARMVFLSPEELSGQPATISSDIYSLGVVLYQMLVGLPPFAGITVYEMRRSKLEPLASFAQAAGIPERLEKVIGCCLSDNLEHRYSDCGALTRALDWATIPTRPPPLPQVAPTPPPAPSPSAPVPKDGTKWVWFAFGGLVLLLITIAIVASQGGH